MIKICGFFDWVKSMSTDNNIYFILLLFMKRFWLFFPQFWNACTKSNWIVCMQQHRLSIMMQDFVYFVWTCCYSCWFDESPFRQVVLLCAQQRGSVRNDWWENKRLELEHCIVLKMSITSDYNENRLAPTHNAQSLFVTFWHSPCHIVRSILHRF